MRRKCFACGRKLGRNPKLVTCADDQDVFVGSECGKLIERAASEGWQPLKGGPRLYDLRHDPKGPADIGARLDRAYASSLEG